MENNVTRPVFGSQQSRFLEKAAEMETVRGPIRMAGRSKKAPARPESLGTLLRYTQRIREAVGTDSGLGKSVNLASADGSIVYIHIDATVIPNVVSNEHQKADVVIRFPYSSRFEDVVSGRATLRDSLLKGHAMVGDIDTASTLCDLLGEPQWTAEKEAA